MVAGGRAWPPNSDKAGCDRRPTPSNEGERVKADVVNRVRLRVEFAAQSGETAAEEGLPVFGQPGLVDQTFPLAPRWRRNHAVRGLEVPVAVILLLVAVFVALRFLAAAARPRGSPARELYERRLRQGPI